MVGQLAPWSLVPGAGNVLHGCPNSFSRLKDEQLLAFKLVSRKLTGPAKRSVVERAERRQNGQDGRQPRAHHGE